MWKLDNENAIITILVTLVVLTAICGCSDKVTPDEITVEWNSHLNNSDKTSKVSEGR